MSISNYEVMRLSVSMWKRGFNKTLQKQMHIQDYFLFHAQNINIDLFCFGLEKWFYIVSGDISLQESLYNFF